MQFETKISGIPCICNVTHFQPYVPMKVYGPGMGDCHPPEPLEFQFEILDSKGRYASWLEKKVTKEDEDRLLEEFELESTGQRYGYL